MRGLSFLRDNSSLSFKPALRQKGYLMEVLTTRFGTLEVRQERIITFENGLLGFSLAKRFALLQPEDEAVFFWLQSLDQPDLAFVVTDPDFFIDNYSVPLGAGEITQLGMTDLSESQCFVIVNRVGNQLTANTQGPLIISLETMKGVQTVLLAGGQIKHPLMRVNV